MEAPIGPERFSIGRNIATRGEGRNEYVHTMGSKKRSREQKRWINCRSRRRRSRHDPQAWFVSRTRVYRMCIYPFLSSALSPSPSLSRWFFRFLFRCTLSSLSISFILHWLIVSGAQQGDPCTGYTRPWWRLTMETSPTVRQSKQALYKRDRETVKQKQDGNEKKQIINGEIREIDREWSVERIKNKIENRKDATKNAATGSPCFFLFFPFASFHPPLLHLFPLSPLKSSSLPSSPPPISSVFLFLSLFDFYLLFNRSQEVLVNWWHRLWSSAGSGREGEKSRWAHEEGDHETTIALFITPGVTEFTIKIPRSAALMDRHRCAPRCGSAGIFKWTRPFSSYVQPWFSPHHHPPASRKIPSETRHHRILPTKPSHKHVGPFDFYMQLPFIDHGSFVDPHNEMLKYVLPLRWFIRLTLL